MKVTLCRKIREAFALSAAIISIGVLTFSVLHFGEHIKSVPWNNTKSRDISGNNCETNLSPNKLMRQPWNSLSSLFFIMPAVTAFIYFIYDLRAVKYRTHMSKYPAFSVITILANLLHCAGTTINHMCGCQIGWMFDDFYALQALIFPVLFVFNVHIDKFRNAERRRTKYLNTIIFILFSAVDGLISFGKDFMPGYVVTIVLVVMIFLLIILPSIIFMYKDKKTEGTRWLFWIAVGFTIPGFVFAGTDSVLCNKEKTLGSHSAFHILVSFALTFLYMYQHSIKEVKKTTNKAVMKEASSEGISDPSSLESSEIVIGKCGVKTEEIPKEEESVVKSGKEKK